jgi:hypothetical protein
MIEERQTDLLEIVVARGTPSALTRCLNRRQEQAYERADDRDHDQQFDKGESSCNPRRSVCRSKLKIVVHTPPNVRKEPTP